MSNRRPPVLGNLTATSGRQSARDKWTGTINAFLGITLSYAIVFALGSAASAQKQGGAGDNLAALAAQAQSAGHGQQADELYARAYESYLSQPYSKGRFTRICAARAAVNQALGQTALAARFSQQAAEFKKLDERQTL